MVLQGRSPRLSKGDKFNLSVCPRPIDRSSGLRHLAVTDVSHFPKKEQHGSELDVPEKYIQKNRCQASISSVLVNRILTISQRHRSQM